ncbi:hypothetical protein ACQP2H_21520 [Micromonospora sp. CA-248260]|uniref:hypothetical protein n=1 Tax=Micromonospora sp. CA-248260 TaxID=3239962 RepID=UPI003D911F8E
MIALRAGVLVQVTRKASPQFVRPILFRLIRVRTEWITYDGWAWLDGYQIDAKGDAVARRSIYVQPAELQLPSPAQSRPGPVPTSRIVPSPRPAPPGVRRSRPRQPNRDTSIDRSLSDRDTG